MPKFYKQNKKRIDPRYFLNEITDPIQDPGLVGVGKITPEDRAKEQIKSQFDAINKDLPLTKKIVTGLLAIFGIPVTVAAASYLAYSLAGVAIVTIIALELLGVTQGFKFPKVPDSVKAVSKYIADVENIITAQSDPDLKFEIKRKLMNDPAIQKIIKKQGDK